MKIRSAGVKLALYSIIAIAALTASADAQISQRYRAVIPFDFHVNGKEFAAGEYLVQPLLTNTTVLPISLVEKRTGRVTQLGSTIAGIERKDEFNGGTLKFSLRHGIFELNEISTAQFQMTINLPKRTIERSVADPWSKTLAISLK